MLSIVITANKTLDNLYERNSEIQNLLLQYHLDYEIIYVCSEDYSGKEILQQLIAKNRDHYLLILSNKDNINSQIYAGLSVTHGEYVMLLTADTNFKVIEEILKKKQLGYEDIYVRKNQKFFPGLISSIGIGSYNLGQFILGRQKDICNDANVMLLDASVVDTITSHPDFSKALRITNQSGERRSITLHQDTIHDAPSGYEKNPYKFLSKLGITSIFYYITLLFMACVFPIFNGNVYNIWIGLAIVLWVTLGALGFAYFAKRMNTARLMPLVPTSLDGSPLIDVADVLQFGDEITTSEEITPQPQQEEKKITKAKKTAKTTKAKEKTTNKKTTKEKAEKIKKTTTKKSTAKTNKTTNKKVKNKEI